MRCVLIGAMPLRGQGRWRSLAGLAGLCLLWALSALRGELFPGLFPVSAWLPVFANQAFVLALFAPVALLAGRSGAAQRPGIQLLRGLWISCGLFLIPGIAMAVARPLITDYSRVALLSLVPVFAVVLDPYLGAQETGSSRWGLTAAVIAVAGTLFVFPLEVPVSLEVAAGFVAVVAAAVSIAAANCRLVCMANTMAAGAVWRVAATAGLMGAMGFAIASATFERPLELSVRMVPELIWSALVDVPALVLLFWLVKRMTASQMTTRYLLAPLLANAIELMVFQPRVGARAGIGLILILAGAVGILADRGSSEDVQEGLHLTGE